MIVDANIAIAIIDESDAFHEEVARRVANAGQASILTVSLGEALVKPAEFGSVDDALATLAGLFAILPVEQAVAVRAARLRSEVVAAGLSVRRLPMLDALVVAAALESETGVFTTDPKWPLVELGLGDVVEVLR